MPKFRVRVRNTRVYEFVVEAADADEACELANEMETDESVSDQFDSNEVLDAVEED